MDLSSMTATQIALSAAAVTAGASVVSAAIAGTAAFVTARVNGGEARRLELMKALREFRLKEYSKVIEAIDRRLAELMPVVLSGDVEALRTYSPSNELYASHIALSDILYHEQEDAFFTATFNWVARSEDALERALAGYPKYVTNGELATAARSLVQFLLSARSQIRSEIFTFAPRFTLRYRVKKWFRDRRLRRKQEEVATAELNAEYQPFDAPKVMAKTFKEMLNDEQSGDSEPTA